MATFKGIEKPCEVCGTIFKVPQSHARVRACSTVCGYKLRRVHNKKEKLTLTCEFCKKEFHEHESHAGRRRFCSRECQHSSDVSKSERSARLSGANNPMWQGGITIKVISKNGLPYARIGRAKENTKTAKRRALMIQATPAWADPVLILAFYEEAQIKAQTMKVTHHVDHIVPLTSKTVCGLHCEFNLQVLPGIENLRKSNRTWPDKP